jgi:SAM-dependent methyltransferase
MNWRLKAVMMHAFSNMPFGLPVYHWVQTNVTRSLPTSDEKYEEVFSRARKHISAFEHSQACDISQASLYEFGAGWELGIPLAFYALGVNQQTIVDIRPLLRVELINDTIQKIQRMGRKLGVTRVPEELLPAGTSSNWKELLQRMYGIRYLAPCDARNTLLLAESFDFVTSTVTLEHISKSDIALILAECRRLLKPRSGASFLIDYQDHYSYCDPRVTHYNFLKYSENHWEHYNPPLHFQNRLRHRDYRELIVKSGFEIATEAPMEIADSDLRILENLAIDRSFSSRYSISELAVRGAQLTLHKPSAEVQSFSFPGLPQHQQDAFVAKFQGANPEARK